MYNLLICINPYERGKWYIPVDFYALIENLQLYFCFEFAYLNRLELNFCQAIIFFTNYRVLKINLKYVFKLNNKE